MWHRGSRNLRTVNSTGPTFFLQVDLSYGSERKKFNYNYNYNYDSITNKKLLHFNVLVCLVAVWPSGIAVEVHSAGRVSIPTAIYDDFNKVIKKHKSLRHI